MRACMCNKTVFLYSRSDSLAVMSQQNPTRNTMLYMNRSRLNRAKLRDKSCNRENSNLPQDRAHDVQFFSRSSDTYLWVGQTARGMHNTSDKRTCKHSAEGYIGKLYGRIHTYVHRLLDRENNILVMGGSTSA